MKKILLSFIIGIFLISSVSAFLGTYEKNETVSVRGKITNATAMNVTIYYPNTTIAIDKGVMTNVHGDVWNYSFTDTNTLGDYVYDYCNQNGGSCKENYFTITPLGKTFSGGEGIAGLGIIIIVLAVAFFFMFFGFKISDNEKLMPLVLLFILLSFTFIIYALHLSYAYTVDILQYESLGSVAGTVYTTVLWLLVGVAIISTFLILISSIKEMGNISKRKQYGDDFNPVTQAYDM